MIKEMNHVGLSVTSLERAIEFYRAGFGMELVVQSTFGPDTEGGKYQVILGLAEPKGRVALLKVANVQIELFEFSHPKPKPKDPHYPVSDHGISHFCIEVEDIEREYVRLKAAGATFHCPPLAFFGKAMATYGRDPDGNVFELFERIDDPAQPGEK